MLGMVLRPEACKLHTIFPVIASQHIKNASAGACGAFGASLYSVPVFPVVPMAVVHLLMTPEATHDRSTCATAIVLPSKRFLTGITICPAKLNTLSTSVDIAGIKKRSRAMRESRGYCFWRRS